MHDEHDDDAVVTASGRRHFLLGLGGAAAAVGLAACQPRATLDERDVRHWDMDTDVLVAGSGSAGTAAAIDARRHGARALVLEKLPKLGGSSAMSGGVIYLGGGTPIQKACGFDDSVEAMYDYIVASSALHPDLEKVQVYCEESIEHFHWLVGNGVPFKAEFSDAEKEVPSSEASLYYSGSELAWPYRDMARPAPRGHVPSEKGWTGGRRLMEALIPAAQALGAEYLPDMASQRLILASDGSVLGLQVKRGDETLHIRARGGVVLACGGFIHNREMARLHAPELFECSVPWGNIGDTGDGILMGIAAGGVAARMNQGFAVLPLYDPSHVLKGIAVNRFGQRFVPEEGYHAFLGHQIAYHQGGVAWLITDARSQYGYEDYRVVEVARADTIAQLEQQLGLPPHTLVQTVDYYNRHAANGDDPLFHKHPDYLAPLAQPPFIAYDLSTRNAFMAAHTFGGLHTRKTGEVLNAWGEAIPGLYAAGRTSWGIPSAPYIASGISVGDCTFFGRKAGAHAAHRAGNGRTRA